MNITNVAKTHAAPMDTNTRSDGNKRRRYSNATLSFVISKPRDFNNASCCS